MTNELFTARARRPAILMLALLTSLLVALGIACGNRDAADASDTPGHDESASAEAAKGSHGGRLLTDGDFSVEVTIFERGVPPEFRVYPYEKAEPVDLPQVTLRIELHRFGGRVDRVGFAPREDYLLGDAEVVEPHSFDVEVFADYKGASHHWKYDSYEGRTTISAEAIGNSGVVIEEAAPATIRSTIRVSGRVIPDEDRMIHVVPRYPGVVTRTNKRLGDAVAKDEVVAIVESNESLQPYEVKSSIAGTVIKKGLSQGEFAREGEIIYTVADLGRVWVDLSVHGEDFDKLKVGQEVVISAGEGTEAKGEISYISPFGAEETQTMLARVVIPNPKREWRPGLFVTGDIVIQVAQVPVAVKASALQTFRDWDVVFMRDGDVFEIAILELGRRDDEWVEVLSGLEAGQKYATENSFVVKADIGKSGATHDH